MHRSGFTLVEILIVVVILGILSAIVTPQFAAAADDTRQTTFTTDLMTFVKQAEIFRAKTGQYPPDGGSGVLPDGFEDYIDPEDWENGTPIGGVWDAELNDNGVSAAIGVHFDGTGETRDDAFMTSIDAIIDNGDLGSGLFRKLGGERYYYVLED